MTEQIKINHKHGRTRKTLPNIDDIKLHSRGKNIKEGYGRVFIDSVNNLKDIEGCDLSNNQLKTLFKMFRVDLSLDDNEIASPFIRSIPTRTLFDKRYVDIHMVRMNNRYTTILRVGI